MAGYFDLISPWLGNAFSPIKQAYAGDTFMLRLLRNSTQTTAHDMDRIVIVHRIASMLGS